MELAQLEALDKERRLTEEMETFKSPPDSLSSLVVQGSNSEGKIMGSNSLGEWGIHVGICHKIIPFNLSHVLIIADMGSDDIYPILRILNLVKHLEFLNLEALSAGKF